MNLGAIADTNTIKTQPTWDYFFDMQLEAFVPFSYSSC